MLSSNKPGMTFSKEHQTGPHRFNALTRAKEALPLSFSSFFLIYLGSYLHYQELSMSVSRTKLMPSGVKVIIHAKQM